MTSPRRVRLSAKHRIQNFLWLFWWPFALVLGVIFIAYFGMEHFRFWVKGKLYLRREKIKRKGLTLPS